jgi:hypothetical protein
MNDTTKEADNSPASGAAGVMPPETVRVKIAVAVDESGNWNASGWKNAKNGADMDIAIEGVDPGEARYYVTAELPLPQRGTIAGDAEAA